MLESWVDSNFKPIAYALILLRLEGYPCVFYGDIYPDGRTYDGKVAAIVKLLMKARKDHAYGGVKDYASNRNCIGFVRAGDAQHQGCAVVLYNGESARIADQKVYMNVGKSGPGKEYRCYLGHGKSVIISQAGIGCFRPGDSVTVWIEN